MAEQGITKNQIISELSKSPHGKFEEYIPICQKAAKEEPEFLAHLIAWNQIKGQVRDSKVALPVVSLSVPMADDLKENSLAHVAMLGPRELLRAVRFSWKLSGRGKLEKIRLVVERYLRDREEPWRKFDQVAVLHRKTLKELYALLHIKPSSRADRILFKQERPEGSVFAVVSELGKMPAADAALQIIRHRIPFLIVQGALGKRIQEPELALAVIERMSPQEIVTSTKLLERLGLKTNPVLRGAYEKKLELISKSKKKTSLKTGRAAKALEESGSVELAQKLYGVQEKQVANMSVEGNWLVLGDRSPSMQNSVEVAKLVAGTLAGMVKGNVWLVFFDSTPQAINVTGASLDVIEKATRHIRAGGNGTSIGCGLQRMLDEKQEFDGIVIVSDGEENSAPRFTDVYRRYSQFQDKDIPIYFYHTSGGRDGLTYSMQAAGIDMQTFDLTSGLDYYSLPNLVTTMRTNRYSLVDEIMNVPLLTLDQVFKSERKEEEYVTA